MAASNLKEIETQFAQLSPEAQLTLLERLIHQVRLRMSGSQPPWDTSLEAMAADPEVQQELKAINSEFRITEADGLQKE